MVLFSYFLLMAIAASVIASISSGLVGSYVVVKRIVFISGSIAHSVLGGMGFFLYLQRVYHVSYLSPALGALITAIFSGFFIGWIHIHHRQREDTVIAAIWALGMSIGVIFTSLTPGYNVDLMGFLFGNILWITQQDLYLLIGLDAFVLLIILFFHKKFLAVCFDETQAYLQGLSVKNIYFLLIILISIVVVILIQIIGSILVIAMLCLPPAMANRFTHRLSLMMLFAVFISIGASILGIYLSYTLNWPPGATIALLTTGSYLSLMKYEQIRQK